MECTAHNRRVARSLSSDVSEDLSQELEWLTWKATVSPIWRLAELSQHYRTGLALFDTALRVHEDYPLARTSLRRRIAQVVRHGAGTTTPSLSVTMFPVLQRLLLQPPPPEPNRYCRR
jgi:hypothetical protein